MSAQWTTVRGRTDQLVSRLHSLGLRETLLIEREVLRRILKSTLAATIAWLAAEAVGSPRPALASLAAIIVVQVTVRATLARSIQLTVAVSLGLGAATALGHLVGLHWWSITLVVLAGLIAGELFRLGPLSGQVSISAMLALSLGSGYGIERTVDTAIGALIGVVVNAALAPPSYVSEAGRTLRGLGEDLGALLADMGHGIGRRPGRDAIGRWLQRARDLGADSRAAIATVTQGEESLQFNPRARGELAQLTRLTEARRALDHAVTQTRGIARSLAELPQPLTDPALVAALAALSPMFAQTGRAVAAFGRLQERPGSTPDRELAERSVAEARAQSRSVAVALSPLSPGIAELAGHRQDGTADAALARAALTEAAVARLLSSVFVDLERLVTEVDTVDGAHRSAVDPTPA